MGTTQSATATLNLILYSNNYPWKMAQFQLPVKAFILR